MTHLYAPYTDKTITSLSGSSQKLLDDTSGSGRPWNCISIQNTGNANVGINWAAGTAAIGGAGTFTLTPGAALSWSRGRDVIPIGQINVIGTAGQPLYCVVA